MVTKVGVVALGTLGPGRRPVVLLAGRDDDAHDQLPGRLVHHRVGQGAGVGAYSGRRLAPMNALIDRHTCAQQSGSEFEVAFRSLLPPGWGRYRITRPTNCHPDPRARLGAGQSASRWGRTRIRWGEKGNSDQSSRDRGEAVELPWTRFSRQNIWSGESFGAYRIHGRDRDG